MSLQNDNTSSDEEPKYDFLFPKRNSKITSYPQETPRYYYPKEYEIIKQFQLIFVFYAACDYNNVKSFKIFCLLQYYFCTADGNLLKIDNINILKTALKCDSNEFLNHLSGVREQSEIHYNYFSKKLKKIGECPFYIPDQLEDETTIFIGRLLSNEEFALPLVYLCYLRYTEFYGVYIMDHFKVKYKEEYDVFIEEIILFIKK